jgi:hypothetical protein
MKGQGRPKQMPKTPMNKMPSFPGNDAPIGNAPGFRKGGMVKGTKPNKKGK